MVGELERRACEEKNNFAGKVNKIAKMIVRIVALEGLQPMVTEAFMKQNENKQCGLEEVEESNGIWKVVIIAIIMIIIIGFAAVIFAMRKLYKYVERRLEENQLHLMSTLGDRVGGAKMRIVEIERTFDQVEGAHDRIGFLQDYNSGLIFNGGCVKDEVPYTLEIVSYDMMGEINAANFLIRRSLDGMRTTEGHYRRHKVMLKPGLEGAVPTEGPSLTRRFKPVNREQTIRVEYEKEEAILMCGRVFEKIEKLKERQQILLGRGEENRANAMSYEIDRYERLLELAELRRDRPREDGIRHL